MVFKLIFSKQTNTGYIRLTKSVKEALNDVLNYEPLVYEVIFPIQDPVPKIKGIYYNDEIICSGQDGNLNINLVLMGF